MSRTILLADDSLTIQKVVELTFADTEYEVVAVSSGDELMQLDVEAEVERYLSAENSAEAGAYDLVQQFQAFNDIVRRPG